MEEQELKLSRETLRDLKPGEDRTQQVRGGASMFNTGVCLAGSNPVGRYTGGMSIGGCGVQGAVATPVIRTTNQAFANGNGQNGGHDQYTVVYLHKMKVAGRDLTQNGTIDGSYTGPPPAP